MGYLKEVFITILCTKTTLEDVTFLDFSHSLDTAILKYTEYVVSDCPWLFVL